VSEDLVHKADEAAAHAYAPYSEYRVGAVVRTTDGREFAGVNVENAAYPLGICAEKSAIVAAAAAGYRPGDLVQPLPAAAGYRPGDLAAIGINASPCGGCRQWLYEWRIAEVSFRRRDGAIATYTAAELLPDTWDLPE